MHKRNIHLVLKILVICIISSLSGNAQEFIYHRLTPKDGLASSTVYSVCSDSLGYLWFGTERGIQRYDGKNWKTYNFTANPMERDVFEIYYDVHDYLSFSTLNGRQYRIINDHVVPFEGNNIIDSLLGLEKELRGFAPNKDFDQAYVSIPNLGIVNIDMRKNMIDLEAQNTRHNISEYNGRLLYSRIAPNDDLPNKKIGIEKFDYEIELLVPPRFNEMFIDQGMSLNLISCLNQLYIFSDSVRNIEFNSKIVRTKQLGNDIYVGFFDDGIMKINDLNFNSRIEFSNNYTVTDFCEDFQGGLWFSTLHNGVFHLPSIPTSTYSNEYISDLSLVRDTLYALSLYGELRTIYKNKLINQIKPQGKVFTTDGFIYDDQYFWTNSGSEIMLKESFIDVGSGFGYRQESNEQLAVSYNLNRLSLIDFGSTQLYNKKLYGIPSNLNNSIVDVDIQDSSVFVCLKDEVIMINGELEHSIYRRPIQNEYDKLISYARHSDSLSAIATIGSGVILIEENIEYLVKGSDGNSPYFVQYLAFDRNGDLWVVADQGLDYFDSKSKQLLSHWDGNHDLDANQILELNFDDSTVYIGSVNGLRSIPLGKAAQSPGLCINLRLNNKNYAHPKAYQKIDLGSCDSVQLKIDFLDFFNQNKGLAYSLDNSKSSQKFDREIFLSGLSWGEHELKIYINDGEESYIPIVFEVPHPWWLSKWTFILFFTLLCILFLVIARYIRIKINRKARVKSQYQNYQQKINRLKMDPHFIFNALNSAQYYIQTEQTEQAGKYVDQFAKLMRLKLEQGEEDFVSLSSEIELLMAFTSIETMRSDGRFTFDIQLDNELDLQNTYIPPMLVQPLIENAILHGFKNLNRGKVIVLFNKEGTKLKIEVIDDGKGWSQNISTSEQPYPFKRIHASDILKTRLHLYSKLFDKEFTIRYTQVNESDQRPGVSCVLSIPYMNQPKKISYAP